jgi:hypothetical protein
MRIDQELLDIVYDRYTPRYILYDTYDNAESHQPISCVESSGGYFV